MYRYIELHPHTPTPWVEQSKLQCYADQISSPCLEAGVGPRSASLHLNTLRVNALLACLHILPIILLLWLLIALAVKVMQNSGPPQPVWRIKH